MKYRPQSPLHFGEGVGADLLHLRALHVAGHVALLHEALDVERQPRAISRHLLLQLLNLLQQALVCSENNYLVHSNYAELQLGVEYIG